MRGIFFEGVRFLGITSACKFQNCIHCGAVSVAMQKLGTQLCILPLCVVGLMQVDRSGDKLFLKIV